MYNFNNMLTLMLMALTAMIAGIIFIIGIIGIASGKSSNSAVARLSGAGTCLMLNVLLLAMIAENRTNYDDAVVFTFLALIVIPFIVGYLVYNNGKKGKTELPDFKDNGPGSAL